MHLSPMLFSVLVLALAAQPPTATSTINDRKDVRLTLYQNGRAFIQEIRTITLPKGSSTLHVEDLASAISPESFQIRSLDSKSATVVTRQSYLLSRPNSQGLLSRFEGKKVKVASLKGGVEAQEEAILLSADGNNLVLKFPDRIEVLSDSFSKRVILSDLPPEIPASSRMVVNLDTPQAGRQSCILAYLSSGFQWSPSYSAIIRPGETHIDLTAWALIANLTRTTFENVRVDLLAGEVPSQDFSYAYAPLARMARIQFDKAPPPPPPPPPSMFSTSSMPDSTAVGERRLYALPGSFDLMPNQVMQAPFLEAPNIAVRKEYRIVRSLSDDEDTVDPDGLSIPVVANLIFKNDEAQRMGRQLPTGTVRLYQADETGVLRFLGEDQIAESASGMEVRLGLGAISDLTAKWRTTDHKLNEPSSTRRSEEEKSFEVTLINRKDCLLTVHVQVDVQGDWTLLSSNFPGIKEQAHTLGFQVPVPSKGHAKLICRVRSQTTR